jgi:hypothetical protein
MKKTRETILAFLFAVIVITPSFLASCNEPQREYVKTREEAVKDSALEAESRIKDSASMHKIGNFKTYTAADQGKEIYCIVIDSCEYIGNIGNNSNDILAHKGNCRFCEQRRKNERNKNARSNKGSKDSIPF